MPSDAPFSARSVFHPSFFAEASRLSKVRGVAGAAVSRMLGAQPSSASARIEQRESDFVSRTKRENGVVLDII